MKSLVFDTSSIITLATNNLLWILKSLKQKFNGDFYIPDSVKFELVDKALSIMNFKLEAIMIDRIISDDDLLVYERLNIDRLANIFNSLYIADGKPIHIVDTAEIEAFALALKLQAEAYVVDERTMRLLIENPLMLKNILSRKLDRRIDINKGLLNELKEITKGVKVIRSSELVTIAYEKGMFDKYISDSHSDEDLIEALLWNVRSKGCSISTDEINELIRIEIK